MIETFIIGAWLFGSGVPSGAAAPTDYSLEASCLAYWYMNGAGVASTGNDAEFDRSANSYDLAERGARNIDIVDATVDGPSGYSGFYRKFQVDSATEWMVEPDADNAFEFPGGTWSIAFWLRGDGGWQNNDVVLSKALQAGPPDISWRLLMSTTGGNKLILGMSDDGVTYGDSYTSTATFVVDTWYHIMFTVDSSADEISLYVDGVADAASPKSVVGMGLINDTTTDFMLAAWAVANFNPMSIDDFGVWTEILVAADALSMMNNGIDGAKGGND